jgi:hypothetical protein
MVRDGQGGIARPNQGRKMMRKLQRACLLGAAVATCAGLGAAQAAVTRSGVISKFDGVDEIVEACDTPTSFVNMPQMSRTFSISGSASSAAVTLSASARVGGFDFDTGFVRLLIDGQQQSPGEVPFVAVGGPLGDANAFTWQTKSLATGSHKAQVQWRTDQGSDFCVDARSLVVLHR